MEGSMKRDSRTVYEGKVVDVVVERWDETQAEVVVHPDSVTVVPVDREGYVTLVRQLRVPTGGQLLELPAGKLDDGEEPLAAAKRELEEETGLRGGEWEAVTEFFTTPGFCRERMHLFFAEGLERGEPGGRDEDEDIELVRLPVSELESRMGELRDAKTLVGLLLYLQRRAEGGAPPPSAAGR
jgi:ADP-ribose pyrophosphatase